MQSLNKILFWSCVGLMSLLVMSRPVQAEIEQVAPSSPGNYYWFNTSWNSSPYWYSTPGGLCGYLWTKQTGTIQSTYTYTGAFYISGTRYACRATRISDGYIYDMGYADRGGTVAAVCPVADPPYTYNVLTAMCERTAPVPPACPAAGTSAGSFYVHTGDFPNSIYLGLSGVQYCADGCKVSSVIEITGSGSGGTSYPALWKLVNGVKQYYAYRSYSHDGETCTAGAGLDAQPSAATVPATDTCAPGQSIIQMGAQIRCLNPSTGEMTSTNSASAVAAAETLAAQKRAAEIAAAQAAAGAAGLDAAGVQTAGAVAAGAGAVAGGMAGATSTGDEVMDSFCAQNPGVDICKQGTKQAQAGGALPDLGAGSWYEKTYPQGVGGVLTDNFNTMKNSPLYGLLNNIVPTLSGTAHNGCFSIEVWNVGTQSLCIPPFVLDALGLFMILTALFAARSIIFGG